MRRLIYYLFTFILIVACNNEQDQVTTFPYEKLFSENLKCMNMPRPNGSYNYPIYPGMDEWSKFNTGQQMVEACQIPKEIVSQMSTQALVQAIWEHPLLWEIFHRFQYQSDFESIFFDNNAYMELTKHADAGSILLKRLELAIPLAPAPRSETHLLELLISQPIFLSQLNNDAKIKVVEIAFQNDSLRKNEIPLNTFMNYNGIITSLLIGRAMVAANYITFLEVVNNHEELKFYLGGWYPKGTFEYQEHAIAISYNSPQYDDIQMYIERIGKQFLTENKK